jgi:hypothetical protein
MVAVAAMATRQRRDLTKEIRAGGAGGAATTTLAAAGGSIGSTRQMNR